MKILDYICIPLTCLKSNGITPDGLYDLVPLNG